MVRAINPTKNERNWKICLEVIDLMSKTTVHGAVPTSIRIKCYISIIIDMLLHVQGSPLTVDS